MKKIQTIIIVAMLVAIMPMVLSATSRQTDLNVALLEYSPQPVQPGQVIDLFLSMDPSIGSTPQDVSLEIVEEFPFYIQKTQDYEYAKDIKEIAYAQKLHFRVKVHEQAQDGLTPIRVKYSVGDETQREKVFDINIETFDSQIEISRIHQLPQRAEPGKEFEIALTLHNADDKSISNVDVTLDLTNTFDASSILDNTVAMQALINARLEQVNRRVASGLSPLNGITPMSTMGQEQKTPTAYNAFATLQSTNKKNIRTISAKTTISTKFSMQVLPTTEPGIYAVPLYISYNDEDNNPFYTRVDIPVVVDAQPNVYIGLKGTTLRSTDFAGELQFQVANRGQTALQYVTIELKENEDIQLLTAPQSVYIGTLGPGKTTNATFKVIAKNDETIIPIELTYADAFNEEYAEKREIEHTIINRYFYRDPPYEVWLTWIILGLVVFILTLYFVKQMSKK